MPFFILCRSACKVPGQTCQCPAIATNIWCCLILHLFHGLEKIVFDHGVCKQKIHKIADVIEWTEICAFVLEL